MTYTLIASSTSVMRDADGAFIPADLRNADYQAYLVWAYGQAEADQLHLAYVGDPNATPPVAGTGNPSPNLAGLTFVNTPTPAPAPPAAQIAAQAYASAIANGLAIVSTATPALNATYGVNATAQANIAAVVTGIAAGLGMPGGGATFVYLDASGAPHTMTQAQFLAFAAAVRGYVYALDLYAAGQGALPTASATIP